MARDVIDNDLLVTGALTVAGTIYPPLARGSLAQDDNAVYIVPWADLRVWDAVQTALGSAAADDLGLTAGAFGTGCWYVTAGDLKAAGATTRRARFTFKLPKEYQAGETVTIRAAAGMLTTVADGSCTIDFECYKSARDSLKTGSDLVSTSATSMNSLMFGNKDFTVTSSGLSPGDELDVRVSITCTDTATVTAVTPAIAAIEILLDIKG